MITVRTNAIILKEAAEDSVFKALGSCNERMTLQKHLKTILKFLVPVARKTSLLKLVLSQYEYITNI